MAYVELLIVSLLTAACLTVLVLPCGLALVSVGRLADETARHETLARALAAGSVAVAALTGALAVVGVSNAALSWVLRCFVVFWLVRLFIRRPAFLSHLRSAAPGVCYTLVVTLLALTISAFPGGDLREVSYGSVMELADLAVDNLIPYNFARYITQGIPPALLEVVPTWSAADRGPLLGLLTAALFALLGLEERGHWLAPTPGLYFVFHAAAAFLNGLVILGLWSVAQRIIGRGAAIVAVLLFATTHFTLVNILFSWPKELSVFFLLVALGCHGSGRPMATGCFLGAALLAHEGSGFAVAAFFGYLLACVAFQRTNSPLIGHRRWLLVHGAIVVASCAATVVPWLYLRRFLGGDPGRLAYLHLFCLEQSAPGERSLWDAAAGYLREYGLAGVAQVRWRNLLYPFDLRYLHDALPLLFSAPYIGLFHLSKLSFKVFVLAVGVVPFVLLLVALARSVRRAGPERQMAAYFAAGLGALPVALLVQGCQFGTILQNWGYLAVAVTALAAAAALMQLPRWGPALLAVALLWNVLNAVFILYVNSPVMALRYSALPGLVLAAALLGALFVVAFFETTGVRGEE